jgi:ATP-binding cassette subfamily B protein
MMGGMFAGAPKGTAGDEETFGKVYDKRVVTKVLPYILVHRNLAILAFVAMLVFSATQVAFPWMIKVGIDRFITGGDFAGLTWVFGIFIGLAALNFGSNYIQQLAMAKVGQGVLFGLRRDMFAHLQKLSLSFYDKTEVGRIMSRVQGDVGQLQEFMSLVVVTLGDLLSLAGIVAALLLLNLKLGLISMTVLPVFAIVLMVWQPFAIRSYVRVRTSASIVNGALNENISGVRVVQSMNRQEKNLRDFDAKTQDVQKSNLYASRLSAGLLPPVDILMAVAIGLSLFFGSGMVADGALELGAMIAFVLYIQRFFDPIRNLTMQYSQLQRSMASGIRIFELLDKEPDLVDSPDATPLPRLRGEVELRNVSFGYSPDEDVTRNVSLKIEAGQTVAIVGPTGAGKTTLVSLLARFYDVKRDRGAILVDGRDIRDVTRGSLASQMSMVLQEPFLFSGTVRENIKYNHTDVSDLQMTEAAMAVGAHEFISRLEDGYDTYLEERGGNLSVGQRQLLSFARAIVADPRILVLDEATANIDSYTEMLVQKALRRLLQGRTAIVIAHRLSTIRGAHKIVVLAKGEIIEVGTHSQLMNLDGLYSHLYHMNFDAMEKSADQSGKMAENGQAIAQTNDTNEKASVTGHGTVEVDLSPGAQNDSSDGHSEPAVNDKPASANGTHAKQPETKPARVKSS